MKRSGIKRKAPMKRAGTPLKRTALKAASSLKSGSTLASGGSLKRQAMKPYRGSKPAYVRLRAAYVAENQVCQYREALRGIMVFDDGPVCCEHIWARHGVNSEHWSVYATVGEAAHRWKHDNDTIARIAITAYKRRLALLTNDPRHFDLAAIHAAIGRPLVNWLQSKLDEALPAWAMRMARELIAEISPETLTP